MYLGRRRRSNTGRLCMFVVDVDWFGECLLHCCTAPFSCAVEREGFFFFLQGTCPSSKSANGNSE